MHSASVPTAQKNSSGTLDKRRRWLLVAVLSVAMVVPSAALDSLPDPVLIVNGEAISRDLFLRYAQERADELGPVVSERARRTAADELILQTLLVQEARRHGLDANPAVKVQLELLSRGLLATAALQDGLRRLEPDPPEIDAAYQDALADVDPREYLLGHILVNDVRSALEIINRLDQGEKFPQLAREESLDPTADTGGDLGWISITSLGSEMAAAVADMPPGSHSREPVRTRHGWHVLRLEAIREVPSPDPSVVRDRLLQNLRSRKLDQYLQDLRDAAAVENRIAPP